MARRRIFWHIGPDDIGTGYLARALDVRRAELAEAGVLVPGATAAWELATVELRQNHQQLGYRRREVDGRCAALARQIWRHRGTSVLSTAALAAATPEQVSLALDGVRGAEIHLVFVVRDLTSQVYAGAQAALEQGATTRPARYADRVLTEPDHPQAQAFHAAHHLPGLLRRWTRTVLPAHVHVIAETDPTEAWRALTGLLGTDVTFPDAAVQPVPGPDRLDLLRTVSLALDDRLDPRSRRTTLRDWVSRDLLAAGAPTAYPPVVPRGWFDGWQDLIQKKEFDMHGEFRVLDGTTTTVDTDEDAVAVALADAVVEVARLRSEVAHLQDENTRLDLKRRKHKRRLRQLTGRDVA